MKVFLSWSGHRSKAVADILYSWLPQVIQAVEPWMSSEIEKGRKWSPEISGRLNETPFGIICLTRENLASPWILFEAGALSKTPDAYTWTLLYGLSPTDVQQPLAQFQHTVAEEQDLRRLLHTINQVVNSLGEKALAETVLDKVFTTFWPELQASLAAIPPEQHKPKSEVRTERELLEEVLELIRSQERRLSNLESGRGVAPVGVVPWSPEEIARFAYLHSPHYSPNYSPHPLSGRWPPAGLQRATGLLSETLEAVSVFVQGTHAQVQRFAEALRLKLPLRFVDVVRGPEVQWEVRAVFAQLQEETKLDRALTEIANSMECSIVKTYGWVSR